jgi:hypothetical protein
VAQDLAARSCDQRIDVRPDCGDTRRRTRIYFSNRKAKIAPCSLRIQRVVTNRDLTLSPAVGLTLDRARFRHRSRACSAPAGLAPATPPVCRRAIRPAVAARLAPAPAAAPRAEDCPAGFPAAVRLDGPASEAGFRAVRSASCSFGKRKPVHQRRGRGNVPCPRCEPIACCCGSCRSRRSRARACRRCSHPATRCATNARLRSRAATKLAAPL